MDHARPGSAVGPARPALPVPGRDRVPGDRSARPRPLARRPPEPGRHAARSARPRVHDGGPPVSRATTTRRRPGRPTGALLGLSLVTALALTGCAVLGGGRGPASPVSAPDPAATAAGEDQAKLEKAERKRLARE